MMLRMSHATLDTNAPVGDEVKTTTCYMCACRCGIKVHMKDGRVRYIQGNQDHPVNKGVLCAKGSAGIMQQYSPAKLTKPLLRVGERGKGEFREIEWEEALGIATQWLGDIRKTNPDKLAFFTGRDQSQALTGWWAQQFGTINYAAHGGFCSVNMAAGGMYTIGGSFWEFGEPDWDRTKYLLMFGVAEDHDSNPIKLGLGKLKGRGAKIVAVNPVRSGYGAIADEWIGIRPGTDGLFVGAMIRQLLLHDWIDFDYLVKYTNAHYLVVRNPGGADDGLFVRDAEGRALCWDRKTNAARDASSIDVAPAIAGEFTLPDGRRAIPAFQLLAERFLTDEYAADNVASACGVDAQTIRRIAAEMADVAFNQSIRIEQSWTDTHGRTHSEMIGRPVSMHAMRGISAHSNGFHTCRMLHVLQMLLGAIDTPGSFRYQPPYPKPVPPANKPGKKRKENGALDGNPLGYVSSPEDLVVDANGAPRRLDKAFSWEFPLAAHGMMHAVIRNACNGDPYRIDTLFMFMANMGWNSSMNTGEMRRLLAQKTESGEYAIPHILYVDAFYSETVAFADLVLPDTTYLERHDCISLLDRPISDAESASDSIRQPIVPLDRDVRPFQDVLLDLGARLKLPGMLDEDGSKKYPRGFAQFMVEHERTPGVGLLAGWRGANGESRASANRIRISSNATRRTVVSGRNTFPKPAATTRWSIAIIWSGPSNSASSPKRKRSCWSCIRRRCRNSGSPRRVMARSSRRTANASASRNSSIRCRSTTDRPTSRRCRMTTTISRSARSPSGRCSCITRGDRRTPGCGRSPRAISSTSIRIRRPNTASPTATWCSSNRRMARSACRRGFTPAPRPARCGPGTPSASVRMPGNCRKTHPSIQRDFYSTT